ncbi:MAG: Asp-tRNA(Asn)/Glu-tRNA(Gln) amidotransferase subunit GatB [Candidatus Altiarchaeota archaeon]
MTSMLSDDIKVKIGLEVHVPLNTEQKLFCHCPTNYYEVGEANINTCPVCTGMPGAKPYPLNEKAIESAIMVAELLNCNIVYDNIFVKRKHYDYPDLPSGYQRTSEPIGRDGKISGVGIWEVHMEEDPGRYDLATGRVDYNRSGVPLIEVVTAPDMKTPEDVRNFLKELTNLLKYTNRIIDVGGVMRADVNISIEGGARVEIKNINSVRGAYKALKFEILRQKGMMKRGVKVIQETRGFDEKSMITVAQRVKETAADYRYIPDPDIPPQQFDEQFVRKIELPETPQTRKKRLLEKYGIAQQYADTLVRDKDVADLYEAAASKADPKSAAMWVCREVLGQLNYRGIELSESKLTADMLVEIIQMVSSGQITETVGKKLLEKVIDSGKSPEEVVKKESLGTVSGESQLSEAAESVITENQQAVSDYKAGKAESLNFLMGQVMKKMRGRAEPSAVMKILKDRI